MIDFYAVEYLKCDRVAVIIINFNGIAPMKIKSTPFGRSILNLQGSKIGEPYRKTRKRGVCVWCEWRYNQNINEPITQHPPFTMVTPLSTHY
jgi:hypothetical protein